MIKSLFLSILVFLLLNPSEIYSQARPSLQFNFGLTFPGKSFGGDLVTTNDSGVSFINSDFVKSNYGTSTGVNLTGVLKFPLDQKGVINGVFLGSYSFFNAFRKKFLGTTIQNNVTVPVSFDNRFTVSTFGFGADISPSPNAKFSPFVNANLTLNFLSLTLSKDNLTGAFFNDAFRIGMLLSSGVSIKLGNEYSLIFSGSYHASNLFLKSTNGEYLYRIVFDTDNLPINDEEGRFYTNLSNPNLPPELVEGSTKKVNWWGLNFGVSIMLGKSPRK